MIFTWILVILSWMFFLTGFFIVISCVVGMIRFKDFFIRAHIIKISNLYGVSAILFALGLREMDPLEFLQLSVMIVINILMTLGVVHSICRTAVANNVVHSGISRKKYTDMVKEKEKEEFDRKAKEEAEQGKVVKKRRNA